MAIDLSKAKVGDTVKFRCGGEAVIKGLVRNKADYTVHISDDEHGNISYELGGSYLDADVHHPFDITEVIPAPVAFDWSTARWGMGFINGIGSVYIYCGGRGMATNDPIFYAKGTCDLRPIPTAALTRAPEHDVEAG